MLFLYIYSFDLELSDLYPQVCLGFAGENIYIISLDATVLKNLSTSSQLPEPLTPVAITMPRPQSPAAL